jgi:type IV pilus assembly protein PilW
MGANLISLSFKEPGRQRGFTLVELFVGMTIALIAILVMTQVLVSFDSQKRFSSGGADAQNSGMIAMHTMEADIRQGGYGMATMDSLYCTFNTSLPFNGRPFVPVMIIPANLARTDAANVLGIPPGDADTDVIAVMYSQNPTAVEGVPLVSPAAVGATAYNFGKNVTGFAANDFVLSAQAGLPCTVAQATSVNALARQITVNRGAGAAYTANTGSMFNLGPNGMVMRVYAVRGGSLTVCDFWTSNCAADISGMTAAAISALWVPIASNIVGLRAQYGWDTSGVADMNVDAYCRSRLTPASANCPAPDTGATVPNTSCDWTRIGTLRVALVARSPERGTPGVNVSDATIRVWPDSAVAGTPTTIGPVFAVANRADRHRAFETTVPIRNIIWHGAQASCT